MAKMSKKSVLDDAAQVALARAFIEQDARLQVLESETNLSRERLIRLYKEIKLKSPPKGMLPFSTDSYYEMKNTSQFLLDVPYESPSESVSEFANESQDQELAPELIDAYFSAKSSSSYILESEQDLYLWESLDANDLEMPIEAQVLGP